MTERRLPQFMVIGAVKAATTWISEQLRHHPALWLPEAEPHFFSSEYHRGLDWYGSLFEDAPPDRIVGEKSADYLAHPDAAGRLAQVLPGIPMIVQLRDPVDRAYSDYCMLYRRGMVGSDPRRYLDGSDPAGVRFLEGGRYARHIQRLFDHLPDIRLKVILYEDIRSHPEAVIEEVCRHIGVPTHITPRAVETRSNDSRAAMLPLPMRRLLRRARPALDPLRTNPLLAGARAAIARPIRYPPFTDELKADLRDFYHDDIRALGELLGRDVTGWLKEESTSCSTGGL
jgi:hypothetical protein